MADARDLKSRGPKGRVGSTPTPGTSSPSEFLLRSGEGAMLLLFDSRVAESRFRSMG